MGDQGVLYYQGSCRFRVFREVLAWVLSLVDGSQGDGQVLQMGLRVRALLHQLQFLEGFANHGLIVSIIRSACCGLVESGRPLFLLLFGRVLLTADLEAFLAGDDLILLVLP